MQDAVDSMYDSLQEAYKQIELISNEQTTSTESTSSSENNADTTQVKTEDVNTMYLYQLFIALMLSLIGLIFVKKKIY